MNNISTYRKKAQLSQQALAQKIGWNQPRLANYESFVRTPSLSDSRKIIFALNEFGVDCSLDDVFPPGKN
ncbi:Helix-turn-helix [Raoultella terrigena]|uniref:Helix-turn-helix n=1 Tax=Raoultella terrigena TaxID=577 RepID=A0A4V6J2V1_RAOTE|nr:Helix-turn-helix [Raoultella terrigena]